MATGMLIIASVCPNYFIVKGSEAPNSIFRDFSSYINVVAFLLLKLLTVFCLIIVNFLIKLIVVTLAMEEIQ